ADLRQQFQILDAAADAHSRLMGVNHADERLATSLAANGLAQKVLIAREGHSSQLSGAVQHVGVQPFSPSVFLRRNDINAAPSHSPHDLALYVLVHVEGDHEDGGSFCCARRASHCWRFSGLGFSERSWSYSRSHAAS